METGIPEILRQVLAEATQATRAYDEERAEELIDQLVAAAAEAVPVMIQALRKADHVTQEIAIHVLHRIGYRLNASSIPELIYHIADMNLLGWQEATETLMEMGADVVVPHLIAAFLEKESVYHSGTGKYHTWAYDVEGLCEAIHTKLVPVEYAVRCGPAICYLLAQLEMEPDSRMDLDILLDVIEKAGTQADYALPVLIQLAKHRPESLEGKRARTLLATFPEEVRAPYSLLISQL